MNLSLDQLVAEAAKLSGIEQRELIERLLELKGPLHPAIKAEWDDLISSRAQEILTGSVKTRNACEILEESKIRYKA